MQAVRFTGVGEPTQIESVVKPSPGPGQVLIKIGGAGVCHSDLHVMEEDLGFKPPFTLGHENAGWVSEVGEGVTGLKEGDAVAVYGPWGCGRCHSCQLSMENYCENWASIGTFGGGLGSDGGMAEYMLVPAARLLVPLGDLSPAKAAPLSDAALTPYHAIKRALPQINAESTVVVMGVGGLGAAGTFPLPPCRTLSLEQTWRTNRMTSEEDEHDKANACRFLRTRQSDERASEERMDQSVVGYRQQRSEAKGDCLRLGALVPLCDVGDRARATTHDSRLRWLSARAL